MRKRIVRCARGAALAVVAAASLSAGWSPPAVRASAAGNGEFIIRCPMTGEVQAIDPIMAPAGTAPHVHMFFGNDSVSATSTAPSLRSHGTTCQDSNDTAAYWAPESFLNGSPFLPGCTLLPGGSGNYRCGTDPNTTIYIRAYYLTGTGASTGELPPGLIMVAGTPDATAPPSSDKVVSWTCGANPSVQTPVSLWPYDCSLFRNDPNFGPKEQEGLTEIIDFPSCWNGLASFTAPNGTAKVPGYFDPSLNMGTSDLAYPPCAGSYDHPFPHVSMRIHYVGLFTASNDTKTIYPSSCAEASGLSETCQTQAQRGLSVPPDDIGLQLSSTQTGGAPGPWYTAHADYWQTWQQGSAPPSPSSARGTLNSLTYYCLDLANTCKFITNANYPPPPG
jgi:Domain of unknown function (DUF1996)